VLPTVVDRCHRFDFARPSVPQITDVVRRVAAAEEIEIPDEAVALVARSATGSFRDALGTLEQLVAYSGRTIALDDVLAVLGAADADLVFGAVDAVAAGNAREALLASARLAESGRDLGRFFSDLEAHARALMVVQALGEVPAELRVTPEQDERLAAQAKAVAPADVVRLLDMIAAALRALKDGADARTQLELALVKAAEPAHDPTVKALLARIERLEARAGSAQPPPPAGKAPSEPATAAGRTRVAVSAQVEDQPPVAATTTLPGAPHGAAPEQAAADVVAAVSEELDANVTAVAVVEPEAPAPAEPSLELSLDAFADMWPGVIESLEGDNHGLLAALLREATPLELTEQGLTLAWPESAAFLKRQAEDPAKRELLADSIRAVTGASLRLAFELRADEEVAQAGETIDEDELVERFKREFGAVEEPPPTEET
jgi:DNA polymerase-3 subunit gamma/tau